ncbi:MAG: 4Fe-4S dicluster domain-containing protein [bacterium]
MRQRYSRHRHARTAFVSLDSKKCMACWQCLEVCSNNVIGRINMPWHKHAKFVNAGSCTGCFKCVKICETHAISKLFREKEDRQNGKVF